ncbi:hypothetical protein PLICRDRAFT_693312 [Plicaturopsis crispa FD-325 SS-3]|nr:hypothetical protein PLICRDRAFT_693312 [Plicaturopsis crispa FD-325 SS-3]
MKAAYGRVILQASHRRLRSPATTAHLLRIKSCTTYTGPRRTLSTRGRASNSSLAYQKQSPSDAEASSAAHEPADSSTDTAEDSPLKRYHGLINSGAIRGDEHQTRIIQKLQNLHDQLKAYEPPPIPSKPDQNGIFSRLFSRAAPTPALDVASVPRGLYLYGDVGTGKTMLMDMFYQTLPPSIKRKRRVHFHAFMIDVHKRVHAVNVSRGYVGGDQVLEVARQLAADAYILCFDEFQVTDISDAMILKRLIGSLLDFGVVCVFTSNRHPDELYKNGIQRSSFIPTIELLKTRFDVTDLDSGTDYRRIPRALSNVYYSPLNEETRAEIDKLFTSFTDDPADPVVHNHALHFWGRKLLVPESTSKVARFTFHDLCENALSAADYLEVTKTYETLFVTDVPKMGYGEKDMARRFITFIDACYESKTKLFVSSEVPIFKIFADDQHGSRPVSHHMRSMMDDLGLPSDVVGSSTLFTMDEEVFAFARACSRLIEMGSQEWAATAGGR